MGRPSTFRVSPTHSTMSEAQRRAAYARLQATCAYKKDTWDFVSSDCDQGLFFYMLFVVHSYGSFAAATDSAPRSRHW